jgi:hypothetical protein
MELTREERCAEYMYAVRAQAGFKFRPTKREIPGPLPHGRRQDSF